MSASHELDERYSIYTPVEAQASITGYRQTDPWLNQANDVMRGIIMGASTARQEAVSYRNFTIGAFGAGLRQQLDDGSHVHRSFHGANQKPESGGSINIHAEQAVITAAERHGATLTSLALYGDNQPDQKSGLLFPAIVPCSAVCLPALEASTVIDQELTLFSSLSPDRKVVMLYSLPELATAYSTDNPDMIYRASFDKPLELFDPKASREQLRVSDESEDRAFDDEFFRKISQVVLSRLLSAPALRRS